MTTNQSPSSKRDAYFFPQEKDKLGHESPQNYPLPYTTTTKLKQMSTTANAHIGRDHYQVTITAGKNVVIADEGEDKGGKNQGFNPYELLLASLGSCTCATVRMYADRKGINLDEVKVNLTLERDDEKNTTNITRDIKFIGELTEEELAKLLTIANKCPVHKMLSNPINITTNMV